MKILYVDLQHQRQRDLPGHGAAGLRGPRGGHRDVPGRGQDRHYQVSQDSVCVLLFFFFFAFLCFFFVSVGMCGVWFERMGKVYGCGGGYG